MQRTQKAVACFHRQRFSIGSGFYIILWLPFTLGDRERYDLGIMQKMKLIGSKMENDFREELIKSHDYHFSENSTSRLKEVLKSKGIDVGNAYIIGWTPDQTDDLFLVLIDGSWILRIELERDDETVEPVIELLKT